MKTAQIALRLAGARRASQSISLQLRDVTVIAGLLVISAFLLCAAAIYLALHEILPAIAPIYIQERLRVLHRFSLLAARQIRSWR
jgi:hypothetical protein